MGLFNINYNKDGPGVSKDAPKKKRFFYFFEIYFRKFVKLIGLNLLFAVLCIPIVTIGPAKAGMAYIMRNFSREEPVFIWHDFWRIFKENFKNAAIIGIIELVLRGALIYAIYFYRTMTSSLAIIPMIICFFLLLMVLFTGYYVYILMVTVNLSFKPLLINAYKLAMIASRTNVLTLIFSLIIIVPTVLLMPHTAPLVLLIELSTILFIENFNAYPTIKKYCIDPVNEKKRLEEEAKRAQMSREELDELDESVFVDTVDAEEK